MLSVALAASEGHIVWGGESGSRIRVDGIDEVIAYEVSLDQIADDGVVLGISGRHLDSDSEAGDDQPAENGVRRIESERRRSAGEVAVDDHPVYRVVPVPGSEGVGDRLNVDRVGDTVPPTLVVWTRLQARAAGETARRQQIGNRLSPKAF